MSQATRKSRTPRFYAALWASKFTLLALRITRHKGGQLPGVVATTICPDFLSRVGLPDRMVFVTGTNGKTTTTNLVADMLVATGASPLINREGGNVADGIASTLIKDVTLGGTARSEVSVMELDERSARLVFPHITPDLIVVTNLYRDTFTRNSHVGYIFDILSSCIPNDSRLVLNADDLISGRLAPQNRNRSYYSLCELPGDAREPEDIVSDLNACPNCGGRLKYDYVHLGHVGRATCESCGLTTPEAAFEGIAVDYDAQTITVREHIAVVDPGTSSASIAPAEGEDTNSRGFSEHAYHFSAGSVTDLYNLLSAITTARLLGLSAQDIAEALQGGVGIVESRYSEIDAAGKRLVRIASKGENGMACSRGFANIKREPGSKAVVLMLEDYYMAKDPTSTEFIGWFYETDFEYLNDPSIKQIVITGVRSEDMLLRVLLAGIDPAKIATAKDGFEAANVVDYQSVDSVYYSHAIHNEHVAEESRAHLAKLIEGKEVAA